MGGAVCSVAAGHGRNWGQGAVTGCYGPLLLGTREIGSQVTPLVEFEAGCIPEEVLSLVRPPVTGDGEVKFYNGGDQEVTFTWRLADEEEWRELTLEAGASQAFSARREG